MEGRGEKEERIVDNLVDGVLEWRQHSKYIQTQYSNSPKILPKSPEKKKGITNQFSM